MTACTRFQDDIALLAGGDLDLGPERDAAEAHVAACASCAGLLAGLSGDREWVARAVAQPEPDAVSPSLVSPVLARLAAEAMADGLYRPHVSHSRTDLGLVAFARVAASVVLVSAAALLGWSLLARHEASVPSDLEVARRIGPASPATSVAAGDTTPAAMPGDVAQDGAADFRPVRVHRAGGHAAVELEWDSDGRETVRGTAGSAYKVLASASPRDFSEARPVLVAGNSLVANVDLPSLRTADRSVTYFRVE